MPSCLGIYIESNLIKYAKVSKERDNVKLDAFGVKFYDKIEEGVEQIVNETFSYNIPISINLGNENYNYFEMFSQLNEKDMSKAIETEFELLCSEKGYNQNNIESRYMLVTNQENREKVKALHISSNKTEINKCNQLFQKYKLKTIVPLPIAIANNVEIGVKENAAVLNLEEKITLTTIINGQINKVDLMEIGMDEIYDKINRKENSYAKVYDILKNTTIYTNEGKDLSDDDSSSSNYLQDIMPTLYEVINIVKDIISQSLNNIDKLYITGTGAVINNIDLYFQEYLPNTKCEILKPFFLKNASLSMVNVRDYIEVNSAIALGLQGLGEGIKTLNFKSSSPLERLKELSNMEINLKGNGPKRDKGNSSGKKFNLKFNLNEQINIPDTFMIRSASAILMAVIIYIVGVTIISNLIDEKQKEAEELIADTNDKITAVVSDTQKINNKKSEYDTLIKNLESINQKIADENSARNAIPNLLSRIMTVVPKNVQITSIENTANKHIVIAVQSAEYDPLGYFLSAIDTNGILLNTKSNSSTKTEGVVRIVIEGDMPWEKY